MLRSNCKKAMEKIGEYIKKHTDFESFREYMPEPDLSTVEGCKKFIASVWWDEYGNWDVKRRGGAVEASFSEWLCGLPTCFDPAFLYREDPCVVLADILEETEEERARFGDDYTRAYNQLLHMVYRSMINELHAARIFKPAGL